MAVQIKLSIKRGQRAQHVVVAAGATIAGGDAMFLNIDSDLLSKGEALQQLEELRKHIHQSPWPQTAA